MFLTAIGIVLFVLEFGCGTALKVTQQGNKCKLDLGKSPLMACYWFHYMQQPDRWQLVGWLKLILLCSEVNSSHEASQSNDKLSAGWWDFILCLLYCTVLFYFPSASVYWALTCFQHYFNNTSLLLCPNVCVCVFTCFPAWHSSVFVAYFALLNPLQCFSVLTPKDFHVWADVVLQG